MNANNIDIGPSTLDFLNEKKATLTSAIAKLNNELSNLELAIKAVSGIVNPQLIGDTIKPIASPVVNWKIAIFDLLTKEQRLLKTRDVAVLSFPEITSDKELKDIVVKVANAVKYLTDRPDPIIKRYIQKDPEIYYYGLTSWFEEDGNLKSEYLDKIQKAA